MVEGQVQSRITVPVALFPLHTVMLNSFQHPSCRKHGVLHEKPGGTAAPLNNALALAEKWILKQVQDDGFWNGRKLV